MLKKIINKISNNPILSKLTIIITILVFIMIIGTALYSNISKRNKEKDVQRDVTAEDNKTEFENQMEKYASENAEITEDIDNNTSIDKNGNATYFDDYMDSDYPNVSFEEMTDIADQYSYIFNAEYEDTEAYNLLTYALYQINLEYNIEDTYTGSYDDVKEIKAGFIYQYTVRGQEKDVMMTVDCSNYKIRVDEVIQK